MYPKVTTKSWIQYQLSLLQNLQRIIVATLLPGSSTSTKLENIANSLPIWPAKNNLVSPSDSFEPINSFRFPNRRIDDGDHFDTSDQNNNFGVGEISLVSDNERKKITSVGGKKFQSSPSDYKLSDRLDFTSDNEFVVGASLAMNQASPQTPKSSFRQASQNYGVGFATPMPSSVHSSDHGLTQVPSINGQALSSGTDHVSRHGSTVNRGSEVFRLGSGVQLQQPNSGHSPLGSTNTNDNQNYILPTYSNINKYRASSSRAGDNGEIYADIRLESGKKNLLTAQSDPHSLYIDTSQNQLNSPEAEVILYPMGQLLSNSRQMVAAGHDRPDGHVGDVMLMSGSDIGSAMTEQRRDQMPAYQIPVMDTDIAEVGVRRKSPPQGLLETIIRTAKDDLDFAGNVLSYITSRSS